MSIGSPVYLSFLCLFILFFFFFLEIWNVLLGVSWRLTPVVFMRELKLERSDQPSTQWIGEIGSSLSSTPKVTEWFRGQCETRIQAWRCISPALCIVCLFILDRFLILYQTHQNNFSVFFLTRLCLESILRYTHHSSCLALLLEPPSASLLWWILFSRSCIPLSAPSSCWNSSLSPFLRKKCRRGKVVRHLMSGNTLILSSYLVDSLVRTGILGQK
jgi:hypothetical protein